jgi:predicted O-methyltransferase YrrM
MSKLWQAFEYVKYLLRCFHLHGIHSPFVFELNEQLFKEKTPFYSFDEIEAIRAKLLLTKKEIEVEDYGAGSNQLKTAKRPINKIAAYSLKSPKKAQLIYRFVYRFEPETILEIGTSLGITTAYLSKARPQAKIISLEGSPEIAKVAQINFNKLNALNIKSVVGKFEETLGPALSDLKKVGLVFFDGNHQKKPTLEYFRDCLEYADENSIFIFDDIHWSKQMKEAWEEVKRNDSVTVTIDCFEMGIVFFKKGQEKEHFTVYH